MKKSVGLMAMMAAAMNMYSGSTMTGSGRVPSEPADANGYSFKSSRKGSVKKYQREMAKIKSRKRSKR